LVRAAWIALAATAVVAFVALSSRRADREGQGVGERIAAESAQRRVGLQDGSIIDLNAGSGLTVQYSPGQRAVTLEAGEAHFKVAPDPARPFVVSAGDVAVRAVGTAFNVRRLAQDEVEVLVIEGKVEVSRSGFSGAPDVNLRRLVAGERTRMERGEAISSARIEKVDTTAILAALAWQDGITRFSDVPLRDLVRQFNRHNRRQLVVADPELGARKIGGVLALDQVEAFVRLLEEDGDVVADRSSPSTIVLRRAR
jgi:transmembrane sensor